MRIPPNRELFPNAKFWLKPLAEAWLQLGDGPYGFVVNVAGEFIGDERVSAMLESAKQCFQELLRLDPTLCPATWGDAGILAITLFVNSIESSFLELTLCSDHWKARQVATNVYKDWTKRRGKAVKDAATGSNDSGVLKRKRVGHSRLSPDANKSRGLAVSDAVDADEDATLERDDNGNDQRQKKKAKVAGTCSPRRCARG